MMVGRSIVHEKEGGRCFFIKSPKVASTWSAVTSEVHGHRAVVQYMCQCLPRIFTESAGVVTLLAPPLEITICW